MFNIVVFSGGSGSVSLQEGLEKIYGSETLNIDYIINAYDDGKSTGECRKIFNNKILGPSDLRKIHLSQFKNRYLQNHIDSIRPITINSGKKAIYDLFNLRIDGKDWSEIYNCCNNLLNDLHEKIDSDDYQYLMKLLYTFFFDAQNKLPRTTLSNIDFKDFSIGNIFYASCANLESNSLEKASTKMAALLGINDNVHLVSDINLYLHAKTNSGKIINDEGAIVDWNNPDNLIKEVYLTLDKDGSSPYIPKVDENKEKCKEKSTLRLIADADIIIFSCGTQYSSLIPTYLHTGFREAINASKAKKYLVMNNVQDADMKGIDCDNLYHILSKYLDFEQITVIFNENAAPEMSSSILYPHQIHAILSKKNQIKHDSELLVNTIMGDYFGLYKNSAHEMRYYYDLDGTLWDAVDDDKLSYFVSQNNLKYLNGDIITGNSLEHVSNILRLYKAPDFPKKVFCDYGNTELTIDESNKVSHLSNNYSVTDTVFINELKKIPEFNHKISIRGDVVITIKPLVDREKLLSAINNIIRTGKYDYYAIIAGKTTIDIMKKGYNKSQAILTIAQKYNLNLKKIVFIGNEVLLGSEKCIKDQGIASINVRDVYECNVYLRTLHSILSYDTA